MTKVIDFNDALGVLTPEKILERLAQHALEDLVCVAYTKEGDTILAHSPLTPPQIVYMLEDTKLNILLGDGDGV